MIFVTNFLLPIACFFIGVVCGQRSVIFREDIAAEAEYEPVAEDDGIEITHVEYTHDQMGYDK